MATTSELLEGIIYEKDRIAYMVETQSRLLDDIKDTLEDKMNGNMGGGSSGVADILLKQFIENTITEIVIPNNVTNIGIGSFAFRVFLTSVTIPNSVTSIGEGAFISCPLEQVTMLNDVPPTLDVSAFADCPIEKIYVPKGSANAYKTATNWSAYASLIVEINT